MSVSVDEFLFIPHSWNKPLEFSLEWRTNILSMISKGEQRSSLFTWPRRGLRVDLKAASVQDFNYLKRYLYKSLHKVWGVPFWQDKTVLTSEAAMGQSSLQIDSTQFRNFEKGGLCAIVSSWSSYEVGTILELTSSEIVLTENLGFTWPEGTEVYPILKSRLEGAQGLDIPVPQVGGLSLDFAEIWDEDIIRSLGDASSFPVYKTFPVLNLDPDWNVVVKQSILHPYELVEYLGKQLASSLRDYSDIGISLKLSIFERESIWDFRGFFNEMRGQWGVFWLPSHQHDIVVTAPFNAADVTLTIQDIEFSIYWASEEVHLIFYFQDGTEVCRKVELAPTSTSITLDEAIGKDCSSDELAKLKVSFLYFSHLDRDKTLFKYHVPESMETTLTGMRIEA